MPPVNNNGNIIEFNGVNDTDSINFKTKIAGQTGDNEIKEIEIMVTLKYLILGELLRCF